MISVHPEKLNLFVVGQVQITNAFDTSTMEINPPGFDVQDYITMYVNYKAIS